MRPIDHYGLESFDTTVSTLPPRSRLFALPPIGIGTEQMEGLASYVTRLARAHAVTPRRLLHDEFDPDGRLRQFWEWARYKNKLDGLGRTAKIMSSIAMKLTTIADVRYLTLLPLADLLPVNCTSLLAKELRWCPRCFAAMIREGREPCRPLVWSFALYTVCHIHKLPLVAACSHCGKKQKFLPDYPDLIHCGYCGSSLADGATRAGSNRVVSLLDLWIAASIADLVAHFPELEGIPLRKTLAQFVGEAIDDLAGGSRRRFCARLGIYAPKIDNILCREGRVRLLRLLALAHGMGTSPAEMLLPAGKAPQTLRLLPSRLRQEVKLQPFTEQRKKQIHDQLARIVADLGDTRSGLEVARALGVAPNRLIYWFPAEFSAICARHTQARARTTSERKAAQREVVKEAVRHVASRGEFPSLRQVAKEVKPHHLVLARPDLMETYHRAVRECVAASCPTS